MYDKNLIIFTAGFPFGNSESTFLPPEIKHIARYFNRIYLVPLNTKGTRNNITLPENVEVWDDVSSKKNVGHRTLSEYLLVALLFLKEVFDTKDLRLLRNFRYHLSELFFYANLAKNIEYLFEKKKIVEADYLFYTYWFDAWATALSIFNLKSGKNIEIISRAHGFDLYDERNEKSYIFPRYLQLKNVSKVFSISNDGALYLRQKFPKFATKIDYSRLGIDKIFEQRALVAHSESIVLVSCSTLTHIKRVHKIVDILSCSKKNVKWIHFGDGPLKEEIFKLTMTLPANVIVDFRGNVQNSLITKFYAENYVHWFINVSESEGVPVSIMEAISFGIPVIAPNVGGVSEIVNNVTGRLVDKEFDPQEIAYIIENEKFSLPKREQIVDFWKKNYCAETNFSGFAEKLLDITKETVRKEKIHLLECNQCLLNSSLTPVFSLDKKGICNYCNHYYAIVNSLGPLDQRKQWIENKINEIRIKGHNKRYDCIVGVSGGADSSYLAYWAKINNLRPLLVHLDNGWNSELAAQNINNICRRLNFDLETHVINWNEFRELQLAYLKAGVIDIEVLTDHAILATVHNVAAKHKISYILNGFNYATEAIMPEGWAFDKNDWKNIKNIYLKYGSGKPIRTYPHNTFLQRLYNHWFFKLESVQVLNYISYNKEEAEKLITDKLSWRSYGGKHYESVFTKFYQAYILPFRFKIDKRIAHLSNLICSGQLTKEQASMELEKSLYDNSDLEMEKAYVLKKLELTEQEFDSLMTQPLRSHYDFKNEKPLWEKYFRLVKISKLDFK